MPALRCRTHDDVVDTTVALMHPSLSNCYRLLMFAVSFITAHSADDPVGEVAFAGTPGLASSLAFIDLLNQHGSCGGCDPTERWSYASTEAVPR